MSDGRENRYFEIYSFGCFGCFGWFWVFWVIGSGRLVGGRRVIVAGQRTGRVGQVGSGLLYMRMAGRVFRWTGRMLRQVGLALYMQ